MFRESLRKKVDQALAWVLIVLMAVMVIDVLWQVASRYLLASPSSFTDELAAFLLIWIGILGSAYVYGQGEHLAIDVLLQRSSEKMQKVLRLVIENIVLLFALSVMVVGGIWLVYTRFLLDVESASLRLNWGFVYLVVPISGVLILYYCIDNMINEMKK